jgi:hypothetical protein
VTPGATPRGIQACTDGRCYNPAARWKADTGCDGGLPQGPANGYSGQEGTVEYFHSDILFYVIIVWAVITAVLAILVIYRSVLAAREDDQIFLDEAEESLAAEQRKLVMKISRLTRPIVTLAVLSAVLLLGVASVWVYQGFKSF